MKSQVGNNHCPHWHKYAKLQRYPITDQICQTSTDEISNRLETINEANKFYSHLRTLRFQSFKQLAYFVKLCMKSKILNFLNLTPNDESLHDRNTAHASEKSKRCKSVKVGSEAGTNAK